MASTCCSYAPAASAVRQLLQRLHHLLLLLLLMVPAAEAPLLLDARIARACSSLLLLALCMGSFEPQATLSNHTWHRSQHIPHKPAASRQLLQEAGDIHPARLRLIRFGKVMAAFCACKLLLQAAASLAPWQQS
jgi:hypothetical protein